MHRKPTPPSQRASHPSRPPIDALIAEHHALVRPMLARLWDYYRNPAITASAIRDPSADGTAAETLAQARGLPERLRPMPGRKREVVIENDIGWRIHTLVDFMFGKPPRIQSLADDPEQARAIGQLLNAVIEANGGIGLLQDLALLGAVYGHADLLLRMRGGGPYNLADPAAVADRFLIDVIDAVRGVPLLSIEDTRELTGYIVDVPRLGRPTAKTGPIVRLRNRVFRNDAAASAQTTYHSQVWTAAEQLDYVADKPTSPRRLVGRRPNRLGRVPVVHIQNLPQPLAYSGLSEVEPLIPLQDELNTRLSDRANRVTMQAFKMYLGRGIEQFTERSIGPGQMWHSDNPDASIQEFGGDANAPSEQRHIDEVRDALDKTSGVSPVAAGVIRGKVGNLTSQNAVRLVLMGLLARTERKRVTYGNGLKQLCELILHAADVHGILPNAPEDRRVRINWPDPVPENQAEQLALAQQKLDLGVPRATVLAEIGYDECAET
ncbi:MAG: phage portal protein [Planctomycetota bacterium]